MEEVMIRLSSDVLIPLLASEFSEIKDTSYTRSVPHKEQRCTLSTVDPPEMQVESILKASFNTIWERLFVHFSF